MLKKLLILLTSFGIIVPAVSQTGVPVASPIAGPSVVCSSPSAPQVFSVLASNSPTAYTWLVAPSQGVIIASPSASATSISFPNTSTSYTIYCFASNASGSGAPVTTAVSVIETPQVTFSGGNVYCQGSPTSIQASPTTISASSTISYSWIPAAGLSATNVSSPLASPSAPTNYTVTYAIGTCTNVSQVSVSVAPLPTLSASFAHTVMCQPDANTITINGNATSYYINSILTPTHAVISPNFPPGISSVLVTGYTGACSGTALATVSVVAKPAINSNANKTLICQNEPCILTITGNALSYSLNSVTCGTTTTIPPGLPTGVNTFTVSGARGPCISTSLTTVIVAAQPNVSATISSVSGCLAETQTISITGSAITYSLNGTGCQTSVTLPSSLTVGMYNYTVTGLSLAGCSASTTLSYSVSACLGIGTTTAPEHSGLLSLYPNPSGGEVFVKSVKGGELFIYDELGKLIKNEYCQPDSTIAIAGLTPGVYFVHSGSHVQKLVIVK